MDHITWTPLSKTRRIIGVVDAETVAMLLAPIKDRLAELGVEKLLLVGSAARGEASAESDLDFVVQFKDRATFLGFMGLVELLEQTTRKTVDLTTMSAVRPELAEDLLSGARQVA